MNAHTVGQASLEFPIKLQDSKLVLAGKISFVLLVLASLAGLAFKAAGAF